MRMQKIKRLGLYVAAVLVLGTSVSAILTGVHPSKANALSQQQIQDCYDKFNGDITYSRLSISDQNLYNSCRSIGACVDYGEGTVIGSRKIVCVAPSSDQADTATTAPLLTLICGSGGGGDAAISAYQQCTATVNSTYQSCAYTGGGVTSSILDTPQNIAKCIHVKYPSVSVGDLTTAITKGRSAADAITTAAANAQAKKACEDSGGTWTQDPKTKTYSCTPKTNDSNPDSNTVDCGSDTFNWLVCPVIKLGLKAANSIDGFIMSQLNVDTKPIFNTSQDSSKGYYTAWNSFRVIATALIVIAGLVMVASQALGFELLDAYTIRKTLPRLAIAVIGISLSWPLMKLMVDLFDTIGFDIRNLMYAPFSTTGSTISLSTGILSSAVVPVLLFTLGPAALTYILTALLGLAVGFLILVVRQIALIMLIILAPVAIACYILPNTQKVWKLWSENFLGLLVMFPIISALIAVGHIFAAISLQSHTGNSPADITAQTLGIIAYIVPYFLLPLAARLATGIIGNLAGIVNDKGRGAFDRLKGVRQNAASQRHQMRMAGQTKFGGSRAGSAYRRAGLLGTPNSGALSLTGQGRANYRESERRLLAHASDEMLKNDNGRSAGDDLANSLALQKGMNASKFVDAYAAATLSQNPSMSRSEAVNRARSSLGALQSNYGATLGSSAMRVAAFKAKAASTTGYAGNEEAWEERENDAASLMRDGLMTTTDAAAAFKSNQKRADQNGVGFGDIMQQLESVKSGGRKWTSAQMMDKALGGSQPGALLAGHKHAVSAAAPAMKRRLQAAANSGNIQDFKRQLAEIAGRYDVMSQISPDSAKVMADGVMSASLDGSVGGKTIQQYIDENRNDKDFVSMRREYNSSAQGSVNSYNANLTAEQNRIAAEQNLRAAEALRGNTGPRTPGGF